jgi:hypothetical protein
MNIYNEMPPAQIAAAKEYFVAAIYKCLPYKEDKYGYLDNYFEAVLQRLVGFNKLSGFQPEMITIMSLLEYARHEDDLKKYRKAILDACGLMHCIKESDAHV